MKDLAAGLCPFCDVPAEQVIAASAHAVAIRDRYPVSPGHTLVLPRQHCEALFDLPSDALADVWSLVANVRGMLGEDLGPDGFNIGVNEGEAAGQTVSHPHIHVVPRFAGDVPDPRGGIRWVLPEKAPYWS